MNTSSIYKSGLLLLGFISLSSCLATPKSGDATLAFYQKKSASLTKATTGIGAFQDTFYQFARTNCVKCHGASQSPMFAVDDVNSAYLSLRSSSFVSFSAPSGSLIVTYSNNGHCGESGCNGNGSVAGAAVQAWADVENAVAAAANNGNNGGTTGGNNTGTVGAGSTVTTSLAIPANLPNGVNYVPMRWNLSQATPATALIAGAIFELEVQKLSATTYRVRNPKIVGLKSAVRLTGLHVLVKPTSDTGYGVEDLGPGSAWESDIATIVPSAIPAMLPTTPLSTATFPPIDPYSMVIGIRSNQDSFTIAFDKLELAVPLAGTFASISANVLVPKCISCHSTNNKTAGYSFSTYTETLGAVVSGNPGASRLYGATLGANATMPPGSVKLTAAESAAISTWITNGAQNN